MSSSQAEKARSTILASHPLNGGCLCAGVEFVIAKGTLLRPLIACHCHECRRLSGSFVIATKVESVAISYKKHETLTWYASSGWARRGFCRNCGSQLFFQIRRTSDDKPDADTGADTGADAGADSDSCEDNMQPPDMQPPNLQALNLQPLNLQALNSNSSISIMLGALAEGDNLPFAGHIFTSQAHPALAELSCSPLCERWGEQSLTDALAQQGWDTSKDDIARDKSL